MDYLESKRLLALSFYVNKIGDLKDNFFSKSSLSSAASQRLQLAPALTASERIGITTEAKSLHCSKPSLITGLKNYDICLVGKMSANTTELVNNMIVANLAAISKLKSAGAKIATLYCDNYLAYDDVTKDFYEFLINASDFVIFPTEYLRDYCKPQLKTDIKNTYIIRDPWQINTLEKYPEKPLGSCPWRIIWFGSSKNLDYLLKILPDLFSSQLGSLKIELTVLSNMYSLKKIQSSNIIKNLPPEWIFRLVPWSNNNQPEQLAKELRRAHISIIPSDPDDPKKAGSSHNRLVDSIRSGCITVASPLKSYQELSKVCILGNDFPKLIQMSILQYERLISKHNSLREYATEMFNPRINQSAWERVIREIAERKNE
ncbi:hypothetical protein [Synechococcus sp. MU1617]|uniref:hypothetical protein n=1 Tax=Synechococcus sp. MU1617 TaxID=2508346 RepID=UPI001CF88D28|nr:hypothetical protein [Synechococcus sp. MU1617]MCB4389441.1 hypothetical protein [Synechococcus sp. MU1617]